MFTAATILMYMIKDIAAVFCILNVLHFLLQYELNTERMKKYVPVFFLLSAANAVFCIVMMPRDPVDFRALSDFISNVLFILCAYLFTKECTLPKTILTVMLTLFTGDMLYSLIAPYIPAHLFAECAVNIIIYGGCAIALLLFARKNGETFLSSVFSEIPHGVFAVLLLFELTCYFKQFGEAPPWYNAMYIVSSTGMVCALFYMFFKVLYTVHQKNQLLQQLLTQRDYSEKLQNADEELRRFRHDYKNHLIVINAYLENGRINEAQQYVSAMNAPVSASLSRIASGNFAADAIIDYKTQQACEHGCALHFKGIIPPDIMRSEDLCTVLSNLLDNAIRAAAQTDTPSKQIAVTAQIKNGFLVLSISNPTTQISAENAKKRQSDKKDRKNHGIGFRNVERTVKKYNGSVTCDSENGIFTVDIRIKLQNTNPVEPIHTQQ